MTGSREEHAALDRWSPKVPVRVVRPFAHLVDHEFFRDDAITRFTDKHVAKVVAFASTHVPYYARRDKGRVATAIDGAAGLTRLPILAKHDVQDHADTLKAAWLPPGEVVRGWASSSGTSGRPTRILMTQRTNAMFALMLHRLLRWARWDPSQALASLRVPSTLPPGPDGRPLRDGESLTLPEWANVGDYFHTGPAVYLSRTTPVEAQLAWLQRERPGYLITYPGTLETLVNAAQGPPVDSLLGARTISAQLTASARRRLETTLAFPIYENYGLNEIGVVANRCDAGRFHVNIEHCHVEIVDDDGVPCGPGERGRIVVTGLTNLAMPLLRYDTGDVATVPGGPCACGRTLPGFEQLLGRHRDLRDTPPGTSAKLNLVLDTLAALDLALLRDLSQAQLHQALGERYTLRLEVRAPLSPEVARAVETAWRAAFEPTPLAIVEVDRLPPAPGGKPQVFASDYLTPDPPPDDAA